MTGMHRGVGSGNPLIVTAFHTSLEHQFLLIGALVVLLAVAWNVARAIQFRRQVAAPDLDAPDAAAPDAAAGAPLAVVGEPQARVVLRLLFGALWTLDGLLQLQPSMPVGLPSGVLSPSASGAPAWVQHVVNVGVTMWSNHPITAAASAVWIQLGIGVWLLVAPRGAWSRSAGLVERRLGARRLGLRRGASAASSPGGELAVRSARSGDLLRASPACCSPCPSRRGAPAALGRRLLRWMGAFFLAMGVLQAWPGRGTWAGQATPQRHARSADRDGAADGPGPPARTLLVVGARSFASFDAEHGWGVNLVVVIALARRSARACSPASVGWSRRRRRRRRRSASPTGCSSRTSGSSAASAPTPTRCCRRRCPARGWLPRDGRSPHRAEAPAPATMTSSRRGACPRARPSYLLQATAALRAPSPSCSSGPRRWRWRRPTRTPTRSSPRRSTARPRAPTSPPSVSRSSNQHGQRVTLAELRGHVVVLTFLDPVCTTDCPLIAQELRSADNQLGAASSRVEFVAIDANPTYLERSALVAFDRHERHGHRWPTGST